MMFQCYIKHRGESIKIHRGESIKIHRGESIKILLMGTFAVKATFAQQF
jgi:hypothetical protein